MEQTKDIVWKDYDKSDITHSVVHYLFAIDELCSSQWYARAVDIAKRLDVTAGSCSVSLKSLLKKWLIIEDENKVVKLSLHWEEVVKRIAHTRNIFFTFFHEKLWVSKSVATANACKIEHLIDSEVTTSLEKHIN